MADAQAHSGKPSIAGDRPTSPHWYWPPSHDTCISFRCWRRYDRASQRGLECTALGIARVGSGHLNAGTWLSWTSHHVAAPAQENDTSNLPLCGGYLASPQPAALVGRRQSSGGAFAVFLTSHSPMLARPWLSICDDTSPSPFVSARSRGDKALAESPRLPIRIPHSLRGGKVTAEPS